jgi:hypothetical protein
MKKQHLNIHKFFKEITVSWAWGCVGTWGRQSLIIDITNGIIDGINKAQCSFEINKSNEN